MPARHSAGRVGITETATPVHIRSGHTNISHACASTHSQNHRKPGLKRATAARLPHNTHLCNRRIFAAHLLGELRQLPTQISHFRHCTKQQSGDRLHTRTDARSPSRPQTANPSQSLVVYLKMLTATCGTRWHPSHRSAPRQRPNVVNHEKQTQVQHDDELPPHGTASGSSEPQHRPSVGVSYRIICCWHCRGRQL